MVSNGTLIVNGDITPGGVGTVGELSLKANVTFGGLRRRGRLGG
jgi:hypothetical protein